MNFLFIIFLTILVLHFSFTASQLEVDVSWDFDEDNVFDGWANQTSEEMEMEVRIENGELRGSIIGMNPHLDSPLVFLEASNRHYVVFRMMYLGAATTSRLLIYGENRVGYDPIINSLNTSVAGTPACVATDGVNPYLAGCYLHTSPITSSKQAISNTHSLSMLTDRNPYSYFFAPTKGGMTITFDVSEPRWITALKILSLGNSSSPRRCLLQKSMTSGVGPFQTVTSFTLEPTSQHIISRRNTSYWSKSFTNEHKPSKVINGTIKWQTIGGFSAYARYWQLLIIDNYGGSGIGIREINLEGFDETVALVPVPLDNTGSYQSYYLPVYQHMQGPLLRMRLEIAYAAPSSPPPKKNTTTASAHPIATSTATTQRGKFFREALSIDFARIARAPDVWRVRGCLDTYYDNPGLTNPVYNVTRVVDSINGNLPLRSFVQTNMSLRYATTYDCTLSGGVSIVIEGLNFGAKAAVFVGGRPCPVTSHGLGAEGGRVESLVCTLPATQSPGTAVVRVQNGVLPGLFQEKTYLSYRTAPPVPAAPNITNIGAHRVDLVWAPPGTHFDHMKVTGYKIMWFEPKFRAFVSNLTVGNVTTTSVRGLQPATEYVFAIAAMAEGAVEGSAALPTDMYGRRAPTPSAMIGTFSTATNITGTVLFDFDFGFFNANATLDSGSVVSGQSLGPTGLFGAEGNYGLTIVGDANLQNCNVSFTCCDGYNPAIGVASCGTGATVCAVLPARQLEYPYVIDGITRRQVPSNLPYEDGGPPEKAIFTVEELALNKGAAMPTIACGPALRLTPSEARNSGGAFYRRKVNVREGFDTTITFQISNPSIRCSVMDDVNTYCRSRGADGFAFVIQNESPIALGVAGSGLGYEGIFNSLAVEVDTFFNYDLLDFYENHISILTQGFRYNITANHSRALATTTKIPDLTDGKHTMRIKYDPNFDPEALAHPSFQTNGYTSWFLENADFEYGGEGDWGTGFGLAYIYLDDMFSPVITTPLNLGKTLNLDNGRAWVGLTAATGDAHWQAHDILQWQFRSLFVDEAYTPPLVVNGAGAYECANLTHCVHSPDYDHYMRTNNVWGKGHDSSEDWMSGTGGYCAFC